MGEEKKSDWHKTVQKCFKGTIITLLYILKVKEHSFNLQMRHYSILVRGITKELQTCLYVNSHAHTQREQSKGFSSYLWIHLSENKTKAHSWYECTMTMWVGGDRKPWTRTINTTHSTGISTKNWFCPPSAKTVRGTKRGGEALMCVYVWLKGQRGGLGRPSCCNLWPFCTLLKPAKSHFKSMLHGSTLCPREEGGSRRLQARVSAVTKLTMQ